MKVAFKSKHSMSHFESEVKSICKDFLSPLGLSYFHFKRNYKDGTSIALSNNMLFLSDFINSGSKEVPYAVPISVQQSLVYFWDEFITDELMCLAREKNNLYHGMTVMDRYKSNFDCFAFAMPCHHPEPISYYLKHYTEIKSFTDKFPVMAKAYIESLEEDRFLLSENRIHPNLKLCFLPERSDRIELVSENKQYITTYELLCMQLLREGKSYKNIGQTLSMSPRTVETHLARLKQRTGYTFDELFLKSFKMETQSNDHQINF